MASFGIDFDFKDVQKRVGNIQMQTPRKAMKILDLVATRIVIPSIHAKIAEKRLDATGELSASIKHRVVFNRSNPRVEIIADVPYAANLELGSPPSRPDMQKIIEWVEKKKKEFPPEAAAERVAKKLEEQGVEAKPFMRPAFDEATPLILKFFSKLVDEL